jgi:hypothetical protein
VLRLGATKLVSAVDASELMAWVLALDECRAVRFEDGYALTVPVCAGRA